MKLRVYERFELFELLEPLELNCLINSFEKIIIMSKKIIPSAIPPTEAYNGDSNGSSTDVKPSLTSIEILKQGSPLDSLAEIEGEKTSEEGFGAGVWQNSKKIAGLWTKAETRNSWANVTDLGWKKFYSGSDTAVVAMTILAAQALEKQSLVNVLIENDQIVEIYVW